MTEVTPEIIENGIDAITVESATIKANFAQLRANVAQMLAPYRGAEYDLTDDKAVKQAKKDAAALNAMKTDIEDRRKAVKRQYMKPYEAFEDEVKAIVKEIDDCRNFITDQTNLAETRRRQARFDLLAEGYSEFADVLENVVAFDDILEESWLNKTVTDQAALKKMREKVLKLVDDWGILKQQAAGLGDYFNEAERMFFMTHSLSEALRAAADAQARDERIAALKAEVEPPKPADCPETFAAQYMPIKLVPEPDVIARIIVHGSQRNVSKYIANAERYGVTIEYQEA